MAKLPPPESVPIHLNDVSQGFYFTPLESWNTAGSFPRVPVRTEVLADKQLPNGSMYSLHHIYDYYNFQPYLDDDLSIFEVLNGNMPILDCKRQIDFFFPSSQCNFCLWSFGTTEFI